MQNKDASEILRIKPTVDVGKEIAEISRDFAKPLEVLREAIHNSYDAGAKEVKLLAQSGTATDGARILALEIADDGHGMQADVLKNLFGLGFSNKDTKYGRPPIGYKGHGTKIFYQAAELFVMTRSHGGELLLAHLPNARTEVFSKRVPEPQLYIGSRAQEKADEHKLSLCGATGTTIRLVDFTPNSDRLIDGFTRAEIESYLRWFTVFGSFQAHVVKDFQPPMKLHLQGTDEQSPKEIEFGHNLPIADQIEIKVLKTKDARRPFNFFRKTVTRTNIPIQGGFRIDIVASFEGARARLDRDPGVRRQRKGGLYREEERYGLWLCKDYIPVEPKFDWLNEDECTLPPLFHRPLIFVNCQHLALTANRGSVGNSPDALLSAIKAAVFKFISEITEDPDIQSFLGEYQEDVFSRLREKDKKALQRRIERYNKKKLCTITLPDGKASYSFFEPTREITLFGLIAQLEVLCPELLGLEVLDYDDHIGLDLLVRRPDNASNLLDKLVSYTELKYQLESPINHPFDNLYSIICWETPLTHKDAIQDCTGTNFYYDESTDNKTGFVHAQLIPPADSKLTNSIKVIRLKALLEHKCNMQLSANPKPIGARAK